MGFAVATMRGAARKSWPLHIPPTASGDVHGVNFDPSSLQDTSVRAGRSSRQGRQHGDKLRKLEETVDQSVAVRWHCIRTTPARSVRSCCHPKLLASSDRVFAASASRALLPLSSGSFCTAPLPSKSPPSWACEPRARRACMDEGATSYPSSRSLRHLPLRHL